MKSRVIKFKSLAENDLPLLHDWFQKPHIKQWYARGEDYSFDMIKEKYIPRILNPEPIPNFIIYAGNKPIGYIQLYHMSSSSLPDGVDNLTHPLFIRYKPEEIAGIDLFIADEECLGKGYGSLMLNAFIKEHVCGKFNVLISDPLKINKNAIQFFEAYGFKEFSQNKIESNNALMVLEVNIPYKLILSTDRLILRTWQSSDTPLMADISSDPVVMEYFPTTQDLTATQMLIDHINKHYEQFGYALYAVETKDTHEFIGFVGLNHPSFDIPNFTPRGMPIVEIGWRISSRHWGKGYATEAAKAVLHHAFTILKLEEIISFTVVANIKSRRVMEKIGLHCSEIDEFDHPKISKNSPLKRHVLYRLSHQEYFDKQRLINK